VNDSQLPISPFLTGASQSNSNEKNKEEEGLLVPLSKKQTWEIKEKNTTKEVKL